jgi:hypothetical protein
MDVAGNAIAGLRRKLAFWLAARGVLIASAAWLYLLGTVTLVLRSSTSLPQSYLLLGFLGLLPVATAGAFVAARRCPSQAIIRALMDNTNKCGGLLMADETVDMSAWRGRIPSVSAPTIRWRGKRSSYLFIVALAFAVVVAAVPERYTSGLGRARLEIGDVVEELVSQIEVLEKENIIEEDESAELNETLDKLRDEASGRDPVKTWEALDHIAAAASGAAQKTAEDALSQTRDLTELASAADALAELALENGLTPEGLAASMKELSAMMDLAGLQDMLLDEQLADQLGLDPAMLAQLLDQCALGNLTPEQLQQLANMLAAFQGDVLEMMGNLEFVELIDPQMLAMCQGATNCNTAGLVAFLAQNQGICSLQEALEAVGMPGRGGVTRGRADAPMTWTDGSSEENVGFREETLPPAAVVDLKRSRLVGVSVDAPEQTDEAEPVGSGSLADAMAGSGGAHVHTVLPRHRSATSKYFDR